MTTDSQSTVPDSSPRSSRRLLKPTHRYYLSMAPKQTPISKLGAVVKHGNGWRVRIQISGRKINGPLREAESDAQADLERARQCASRNEMEKCLQEMRAAAKQETPVKEEPVDGSPDDPAPQASTASSSVPTHASSSRGLAQYR